jgi:hypothetical protein
MPTTNSPTSFTKIREALSQDLGPSNTKTMGSYVIKPNGIHFATQSSSEEIFLVLRRHPITQVLWILFAGLLIILPILFTPFLSQVFTDLEIPRSFELILTLFWYLATFAFILTNFVLWYFNVNIITNTRVLDIDFPSLLVQEVTGTHIEQIEDVTYKRIGVLATILDYGDVYVQTAGPETNIEFLQVPRPKQIVKVILDLMGQVSNGPD